MASIEGLRRTANYIKDVVGKSVGVGVYRAYKQVDNIKEQLGEPKILQIEKVMVTVLSILTPATIFTLSEEDGSSDAKMHSKFIKGLKEGVKVLSGLGIDLSTLVIPIAASTTTQDSLPFLGLLGKPLGNGIVWVASDMIDARAFKRKDLPRGPKGTYDLLQKAYDESYDSDLKIGVVKDPQGRTKAVLDKEEICAESGGSCMLLYVPIIDGEKRSMGYAHVTEKDVVVNIGVSTGYEGNPNIRPSIEELIVNLKKPEPSVSR